jgi:hypothetical protein
MPLFVISIAPQAAPVFRPSVLGSNPWSDGRYALVHGDDQQLFRVPSISLLQCRGTAFTYILMPADANPLYVGKVEFEADLIEDRPNSYLQERTRHIVSVVQIDPEAWDTSSDMIPSVYVRAIASDALPQKQKSPAAR